MNRLIPFLFFLFAFAMSGKGQNLTDKNYMKKIYSGDSALKLEKYEFAEKYYREALKIKSDQMYPLDQIKICEQKIKQNKYQIAIEIADSAYEFYFYGSDEQQENKENYKRAREFFSKASLLDTNKNYPRERIKEIDRVLYELNLPKYVAHPGSFADSLYYLGNNSFQTGAYSIAKKHFITADSARPSQLYKNRILLCSDAEKIKNADSLKKFMSLIEKADQSLYKFRSGTEADQYDEELLVFANKKLKEAQNIYKDSDYIKEKLNEVAKNLRSPDPYKTAIVSADQSFANKKYENAKKFYQEALRIKPNEQYPKDMIRKAELELKKK